MLAAIHTGWSRTRLPTRAARCVQRQPNASVNDEHATPSLITVSFISERRGRLWTGVRPDRLVEGTLLEGRSRAERPTTNHANRICIMPQ
jgi:hypothetical protein